MNMAELEAKTLDISGYITKPFSMEEFFPVSFPFTP